MSVKNKKSVKQKKQFSFLAFAFTGLFITLLLTEFFFRLASFGISFGLAELRILLFTAGFSGILALLCSLFPVFIGKILLGILMIFLPAYAVYQMGIFNMMRSYTTLHTAFTMAGAMGGYVLSYIKQMPVLYWLILLIPAADIYLLTKVNLVKTPLKKNTLIVLVISLLLDCAGYATVVTSGKQDLYSYPKYQEKAIREFGIERFLLLDFVSLFKTQTMTIQTEEIGDATGDATGDASADTEEMIEEEEVVIPHRTIDDTAWKQLSAEDSSSERQTLDNYLMNRSVNDYNEATGLLEDMNLIYIMIEAFDYIGIDPDLTPTLYSMLEDGWYFSNHYTPKFDTGTSDSELIGELSLVPRRDMNVYDEFAYNDWNQSVFSIFNAAGYNTYAFHNWTDQFYNRRAMLENQHAGLYENYDDLPFNTLGGWQSDLEMMELTVDKYINDDQFMTFYITSSTHFPYDDYSDLAVRYLDEINEVHPDYPEMVKHYLSKAMELDKAMEYLIQRLKDAGKFDSTAIVFYSDHHPLNMPYSYIFDYTTQVDRYEGMNEFRSPFVIYSPEVLPATKYTGITGTYDILPTLLNLYNMDYDPRLYIGEDYFSGNERVVIFPDGDWATDKGIYYTAYEEYESLDGTEVDSAYIDRINAKVENAFTISYLVYVTDYFAYRKEICTPQSSKPKTDE